MRRWSEKEPNAVDVYKGGGLSVIIGHLKIFPSYSKMTEKYADVTSV